MFLNQEGSCHRVDMASLFYMERMADIDLLTIIGPTASGKTALAAALAYRKGAEIISGDSRQVYRGMDLGTGKDLEDYIFDSFQVPYHLIDIVAPGYKYNVLNISVIFCQSMKAFAIGESCQFYVVVPGCILSRF